jgi:hypothetical protein
MSKSNIITAVATMPDDDTRMEAIRRILVGNVTQEREPLLTLKEVGAAVRLGYSQLFRLGVQSIADRSWGGRPRYRLSEVEAYLGSRTCMDRRDEVRKARSAGKIGGME